MNGLLQFQEKCESVFRPELRQNKERAFRRFRETAKRSRGETYMCRESAPRKRSAITIH
ncbi:hypothetical protein [Mesorhizobium sp. GbtcB19]|uniref:hypothetical protein n=1 Tax=Mesorhizobium sp. GbtcB19 TaxID=2824764 RepID=UPI001C3100E0|nr:hypothetical protein [Mesorhizobium sp. GbtcB19]